MDLESLIKKAYVNLQKADKKSKKVVEILEKPKARKSISLKDVDDAYALSNFKPMQDKIFFLLEGDSRMHADMISDCNEYASPIATMVTNKKKTLTEETISTILLDEVSWRWSMGTISQFLGYSCSYTHGFIKGFNDYATSHINCSSEHHQGFSDGQKVLAEYRLRKLIPDKDPDPFEDERDIAILRELTRVTGYWRAEWDDRPPYVGDRISYIMDLEEDLEEISS